MIRWSDNSVAKKKKKEIQKFTTSGTVAGEEVASSEVWIHFSYNIQFTFSPWTAAGGPITASS